MLKLCKVDQQTVHPEMSAAIRKHHFYSLWQNDANIQAFFECCNKVRAECDLPLYAFQKF